MEQSDPTKQIHTPAEWAALDEQRRQQQEKEKDVEPISQKEETVADTKNPFEITIVDANELAEAQARDRGDARMTESKEDRSKNWIKRTATRIWKHNLAQEYYRQKEISQARKEIMKDDNLFAGEGSDADAKAALVERFAAEYDDEYKGQMLKEGEIISPESEQLNRQIKTLINEHAKNPMSEAVFKEERNRILGHYTEKPGKIGGVYADNLFKVAEEVRKSVEHGTKIDDLKFDVKVRLGKAKEALNTTAKGTSFDKGMEWLQNSKVGKYCVNEGVLTAAAAAYSTTKFGLQKILRNKAVQLGTFGGAAAASGLLAGLKESARMERERAQYNREAAKGLTSDRESRRRKEFAEVNYETMSVSGTIAALEQNLKGLSAGEIDPSVALNDLADVESRITLGEKRKIDLFTYSDPTSVEVERTKLLLIRAKLKNVLKKDLIKNGSNEDDFKKLLADKTENFSEELEKSESGISDKDKAFIKLKRANIAKQVANTVLIGAATGVVAQEGTALVKSGLHSLFGWGKGEDSWLQGAFKNLSGRGDKLQQQATMLEAWRRSISGEVPRMSMGTEGLGSIHNPLGGGDYNMRLPEGVVLVDHGNGTFDIIHNGEPIAANIKAFSPSGEVNPDLKFELLKHDIYTGNPAFVGGHDPESANNYINEHQNDTRLIHRELHYDNDTRVFDKNELQEKWGGVGNQPSYDHVGALVGHEGTGMNSEGDYVLNVAHMTPDGSYHQQFSVDAQEAIKKGGLKVLFSLSRDTQQHVFEIPIGPDGNAIIPKDSEIARLMFENHNGHAVFTGKYAEVAQSVGHNSNGAENVRILSTVVGKGHEIIYDPGHPVIRLDVPNATEYSIPPFIPAIPRKPLEAAIEKERQGTKKSEETKVIDKTKIVEERVNPDSVVIETGPWHADEATNTKEKKELKPISQKEFNALKEDLEFLNKKIQSHEGIISVNEADLKSEYGRNRYNELRDIPDGKPVTFNKSELRTIGDGLEKILSDSKIDKSLDVEKKEPSTKTAPAPENLPTGNTQEISDDEIERIAQELITTGELSDEDQVIYDSGHGEAITARLEELLEAQNDSVEDPTTMEEALARFKTREGVLFREYLLDKDADIETVNKIYNDNFYKNGLTKSSVAKELVEQIQKIKDNDQETWLENTASKLTSYIAAVSQHFGETPSLTSKNRTWAYTDIAQAQYLFEHTDTNKRRKDSVGDPLVWNTSNRSNARASVQKLADRQFAKEVMGLNPELKTKILDSLAKETPQQNTDDQKKIDRIKQLVNKIEVNKNVPIADYGELGRLIRETQNIEPIKF